MAGSGFSLLWSSSIAVYVFGLALVFALSSLAKDGAMTIGAVYLVFHYTEMIRHPIDQIRTQMEDLQKAGAGYLAHRRVVRCDHSPPRDRNAQPSRGALAVDFDAVDFAYRDDADEIVLKNLDIHLARDESSGILGRTGSGKSTVARLLTRLYDPITGSIAIGGIEVRDVDRTDRRARIGMVTQEVQLFRATIRENLTFSDDTISEDRAWAVLVELGVGDWVDRSQGLDTTLESGSG